MSKKPVPQDKIARLEDMLRRLWNIHGLSHEKTCWQWADETKACDCILKEVKQYFYGKRIA